MFKNIVPLVLALFVTCSLWGQTPREIVVMPAKSGSRSVMMCEDQDAGNISFAGADPSNQSNDVRTLSADEPIFLCWGDEFTVQHVQSSANFVGDPSRPGVGYAFYTCPPTAPGLTLQDILDDDCTLKSLTNPDIPLVFVAGKTTGTSVFRNEANIGTLSLQEVYNNGEPEQYWFTPITYDNFTNGTDEAIYEDGVNSCVNSDTSQAFSVVYLNPINVDINTGDCGGNLTIRGGLPEFNSSSYTVDIVNADDNTVVGSISGDARHDEAATFNVPSAGDYIISITDNKACTTSENRVTISSCNPATVFNFGTPCPGEITSGDLFCLDYEVSNFNEIVALQIPIKWDTTILDFESVSVDPSIQSAIGLDESFFDFTTAGELKLAAWVSNDFVNGSSLPDGSVLFTACFIAKGEGNPNFTIEDDRINNSPLEIIDVNSVELSFSPNLCSDPDDFSIVPRPPAGQINVRTDITAPCRGEDNGQLSFSFVGGMAPYNLNLRGANGYDENFTIFGQDTIIGNLSVDEYSYLVRDEGLTAQGMSSITNPINLEETDLLVRLTAVDPRCFGENTGQLTAIPFELGQAVANPDEYTYLWDDDNNTTTPILDSIGARRLYAVTITDPNGCTADDDGILTVPTQIQFNITDTPAQCSGVFDGSLSVNVDPMSGTAPFTYSWDTDPEIINSTNSLLPDLTVGDYNLTVTDANGCTVTDNSRVNGAIEIIVDTQLKQDVFCFNQADGMIQISPFVMGTSANIANWNYEWSPNTTNVVDNGAQSVASDLGPGTYAVTITNSDIDSQCFGSATFEIEEPDSLMLAIDITNNSRCQLTIPDGSATLTASGGTGDYAYTFMPLNGTSSSGPVAMNLAADTITVTVMDENACITTFDTIIGSPAPPVILQFEDKRVKCADTVTFLQVIASPGDAPVTAIYNWEGPNNISSTSSLVGSLGVGTYIVTATDENNCITVDTAEITAPPAFDYSSFELTKEPCFGEEDGAFELALTGGTPSYTYSWENENGEEVAGQVNTLNNLPAGFYTLTGEDANECRIDTTIELTSKLKIEVVPDINSIMPTSCALSNTPDGRATVMATYEGGITGEFDFIWSSGERTNRMPNSTASELGSGIQTVAVLESDGFCNTIAEVFIDSPSEINYDPTNEDIKNVSCFDFEDGEINAFGAASGGTPGTTGYTFEWTQVTTGITSIGESITNLTAGDYELVISDENNCLSNTITKTITQPAPLVVEYDESNTTSSVSCAGETDGQIAVIATGGNDDVPYTYEWTNIVSTTSEATNLAPDITYEVTVTDEKGCSASPTGGRFIDEPDPLTYSLPAFDPIQCFGEFTTIRLDPASFSGGNGGDYTYSVDGCPEKGVGEPSCQVRGGSIPITVFDSGGCAYDDVIEVPEPDQIVIEFPTAELDGTNFVTEVQLGGEIELNAEIFNDISVPIADVMWTDSTVICPPLGDCRNGIVNPLNNTLYTIEVIDVNGCEESASILVEVDKNRNVFIPNAFAPNSRGFDLNESFKIYTGLGVQSVNFARVFNRWGTMVASIESTSGSAPSPSGIPVWDGKFEGKSLAQGVYVYIVSVTFIDNTTLLYRGDVTLLR